MDVVLARHMSGAGGVCAIFARVPLALVPEASGQSVPAGVAADSGCPQQDRCHDANHEEQPVDESLV